MDANDSRNDAADSVSSIAALCSGNWPAGRYSHARHLAGGGILRGLVWFGFGMGAHALDFGLHAAAHRSSWFISNAWLVGAAVLATAGLFQFSRLKYRCLDACRTPVSFIIRHWHGVSPRASAFRLGVHHGVYCVGCCWAIMLLMFSVGTGNVGWMLMLGAVMAIEKNAPWGRRLSRPLGVVLAGWAVLIVGAHVV
jgi:predicted metal-binding membrane protein